jgi:type III secretory pathway component EscR
MADSFEDDDSDLTSLAKTYFISTLTSSFCVGFCSFAGVLAAFFLGVALDTAIDAILISSSFASFYYSLICFLRSFFSCLFFCFLVNSVVVASLVSCLGLIITSSSSAEEEERLRIFLRVGGWMRDCDVRAFLKDDCSLCSSNFLVASWTN